ncbi:hypothetical protein FB45DRAFT_1100411 [Roridomyces roridus]|uniref:EF-hand domain-containing protein n=1 Tax=Roridomyces roridus TaxID=1738132 RepID=A0AAD7CFM0_9AGAR|nr:hypothetical protein FB45DRAFT_1100411 [Roridomyces roridus]
MATQPHYKTVDLDDMSIPLTNLPSGSRRGYDPERASGTETNTATSDLRGTWLSGLKKFENSYQEFDPASNASQPSLAFADGDIPKNGVAKFYHYLLNVSIVTRWAIFIIPALAIIWIPGILQLTGVTSARVWGVPLLFWSIWLSVAWAGYWTALAAMIVPRIIRKTLGVIAVGTRRYLDWLEVLHRYVTLFIWTLAIFVTYQPLIKDQCNAEQGSQSLSIIVLGQKLFFALFLCAALLLFEKFSIQWIAGKFHERSYAERIKDQKFAVKALVTLYQHSKETPRADTLETRSVKKSLNPARFFKRALRGVRTVATTTTTAFGNVATEITGVSVLQPNSPQARIATALESANRSRLLARRLFYSFAKPDQEYLEVDDIARFFPTRDEADMVFALFDADSNGDASRDEVELAVMDMHREQLSLEHSMQDLDSAVGRLDNIFMSLYVVIAILIIAVALEAQVATLVTSAGTLTLGLSWLIGGALSDVGDKVIIGDVAYIVKEIRLLSTIFLDSNGVSVQAPNTVLNSQFIHNIRRSPQTSETFTFDVNFSTTFEKVEALRQRMLKFVTDERRDYRPSFDIVVQDFADQAKMTLQADINYKSNGQQGALKAKRRNKWLCELKLAMAELGIYGPSGNPNPEPGTQRYTEVPWEEVKADELRAKNSQGKAAEGPVPEGGWRLSANNAVLLDRNDDIFGDPDELSTNEPRRRYTPGHSNTPQ